MATKPTYVMCKPATDAIKATSVPTFQTQVKVGDPLIPTGLKILSAASFNCEPINIDSPAWHKGGTIAVECIYKNAIGTLKVQQSVSGLMWTDITSATLTLADSGTEQVQCLNLSVGSYAGNYLRIVWTASSAGTGYLIINVA